MPFLMSFDVRKRDKSVTLACVTLPSRRNLAASDALPYLCSRKQNETLHHKISQRMLIIQIIVILLVAAAVGYFLLNDKE